MCSPVFNAMLKSPMKEAEMKRIQLPGKKTEHISELFRYFYMKSVDSMFIILTQGGPENNTF